MKKVLVLIACAVSFACGSGSSSANADGTVSGTLTGPSGEPITISSVVEGDSITYSGQSCNGSDPESAVGVVLSTRGGACGGFESGAVISSSTTLYMLIIGTPGSSGSAAPSIGAASYTVGNPLVDSAGNIFAAAAQVSIYDATCNKVSVSATSGGITVESISGGVVSGTFDLTFSSAGSFSGSFQAPACQLTSTEFCALGSASTCSG